ncbi:sensor histidine kinase [Auraticoccus monumenti]|uniref:histidine kinase n=1 Tax=Auraticoccus monumenti TaxID=675864 RepID=A0A1G7C5C9_9ACTN|nr:histidine kinase [Auraticoccus monumenti]SDE33866.1 Histidine kinase [Auraticoccus monumenti]
MTTTQHTTTAGAVRGGMPRTALALAVTGWLLATVALLMYVTSEPDFTGDWLFIVVDAVVSAVYATVAAVVLARRRHVVAGLLSVTAVGGGLAAFGGAYLQFTTARGLAPVELVLALFGTAWVPGTLALFLVVPWLVRDHPLGREVWGVVAGALVSVSFLGLRLVWPDSSALLTVVVGAVVVMGLVTAASVEWRRRHGPVGERNGLGWLGLGTAVMALSFAPLLIPYGTLPFWIIPALHLACQALFPAAILAVLLRSRLWGLELVVSRAVLAQTLVLGLLALYLLVSVLATRLIGGDGLAQLVAAATVVAAVQPSRLWLQRRIAALVHGQAHDPRRVAARMGSQLARAASTEELLQSLVETVGSTLRLESAALLGEDTVLARWGTPTSTPQLVELRHREELIGRLAVTLPPGESLGARGTVALEELSVVVASGLTLARSVWDLEAARDRLTRARLQERRLIRRELHDGLGPWLAGLRLGLRGAANLVERDPGAAVTMLGALQAELDQRIEDVRGVARSLLPPVLDELGLAAALEEMVARNHEGGLTVELRVSDLDGLPAPVAAAGYAIASESVINVVRHAGVDTCELSAVLLDGELQVTCTDRGTGVDDRAVAGVGTTAMRERAAELGGTFDISPHLPTGTRVHARIPVRVLHDPRQTGTAVAGQVTP